MNRGAARVSRFPEPAGPVGDRGKVVVAECPSYSPSDVGAALAELLTKMDEGSAFVRPGETVLLKPNLFSAHPPEHAVTTHPELVRQVILQCEAADAGRIWVGDSPVGAQDEKSLWSRTGMDAAVSGTRAELRSWHGPQVPLTCGDDMLAVPAWFRKVDKVISLPKLKTHCLTTLTCALKNVFGVVSGAAKLRFHLKYPSPCSMSAFLVRVHAALKPHMSIADAVVAMEGNGPAHGRPRPLGILLASRDAVALDATACRALETPATVPMIRLAAEGGLGVMDEDRISLVGSGIARLRRARMRPSLSRFLRFIPEPVYRFSSALWQLRPKIMPRECVRCGRCVADCPKHTIRMDERTRAPRINHRDCIACFCCVESCPQGAIALQLYLGSLFRVARKRRRKAKSS